MHDSRMEEHSAVILYGEVTIQYGKSVLKWDLLTDDKGCAIWDTCSYE